jgi:hypothetical protein
MEEHMWNEVLKDNEGRFFLNEQQILDFLNINKRTLIKLRREQKISFRKISRGIYYYIIDPKETVQS